MGRPMTKIEKEMAIRLCDYQDEVHELRVQITGLKRTCIAHRRARSKQDTRITELKAVVVICRDAVEQYAHYHNTEKDVKDFLELVKEHIDD